MPGHLTPAMSRVLTALADYHYLMARQLPRLGLVTSVGAAQKLLRRFNHEIRLKTVPGRGHLYAPNPQSPIAAVRAGVDRNSGRIARLYYLTRLGAEQVAELRQTDPETVFYPKGDKLPLLDVLHRAMTIDCWIELNRFAAAGAGEVEFFHPYFRTTGANRAPQGGTLKKLTRIDFPPELALKHKKPFFWPDAVFVLRTPKKRVLCLLEVYRGIDTGRVIRQLEWHLLALEHGLPSLKYGFQSANKVLVVFETEVALDAVLKAAVDAAGVRGVRAADRLFHAGAAPEGF